MMRGFMIYISYYIKGVNGEGQKKFGG